MVKTGYVILLMLPFLLLSCTEEKVPAQFFPRSDHERYWHKLEQADLLETALGIDWNAAAENIFKKSIEVQLPYSEAFHFDPRQPEALGYRFSVKKGRKVLINVSGLEADSLHLFMDVFRVENDSLADFVHVASADSSLRVGFEPRRDAAYILRVQPELLRGGSFTIQLRIVPSLRFPVAGKNSTAIQSVFGDPRDGGRREHHGVDIFARRHTPIIAPCRGYVRFVGERGIGGKVIWIYDPQRHQNLYFAHLQEQLVKSRTYVNPGDTIGTVGNSGNARTTPPHLHFGIYSNGPIDPFYFITETNETFPAIKPLTHLLGDQYAIHESLVVHSYNSPKSKILDTLQQPEKVNIKAITHDLMRIATEKGTTGYILPNEAILVSGNPE